MPDFPSTKGWPRKCKMWKHALKTRREFTESENCKGPLVDHEGIKTDNEFYVKKYGCLKKYYYLNEMNKLIETKLTNIDLRKNRKSE